MEKAWYWKVVFVLALVVGATLYSLPTFVPDSLPEWYTGFFDKRVNLGLDLQGGSHLVLGVDVDKALEDKADQMASDFKELLREKRIPFSRIYRVPGSSDIQFELENPDDLRRFEKRALEGYYNLKMTDPEEKRPGLARVTFDEKYVEELRRNARDQARSTVENRVNEFRVAEPIIAPHGENGILVQLPGMFDPERAKKLLGRTAQLEFRVVDDASPFFRSLKDELPSDIRLDFYTYQGPNDEPVTLYYLLVRGKGVEGRERILDFLNNVSALERFLQERNVDAGIVAEVVSIAKGGLSPAERAQIMLLVRPLLAAEPPAPETEGEARPAAATTDLARFEKVLAGRVPEGRLVGFEKNEQQLEVEYKTYLLDAAVAMTGDYITDAVVRPDADTGRPEVGLDFDRTGAVLFEKLTGAHVKERMAIVLEGDVVFAPVIQTRIAGGKARITMGSGGGYDQSL
jgi:protein-export membrane protein SecD